MNSTEKFEQLYIMRLQQVILRHLKEGVEPEELTDRLLSDGYESEDIVTASNSLMEQISKLTS